VKKHGRVECGVTKYRRVSCGVRKRERVECERKLCDLGTYRSYVWQCGGKVIIFGPCTLGACGSVECREKEN
jgi:hypothetical protein